jgi:hypothetical protein
MAALRLHRLSAGRYKSHDGRVEIESIHPDEKNGPKIGWILWLDGEMSWIHRDGGYYTTKAEAVTVAETYLVACKARGEYGNR